MVAPSTAGVRDGGCPGARGETHVMKPYRIRFMTEAGCDFALWGDPLRPLPVNGEHDAEDLEHLLPISEDLRTRILEWASCYDRYDAGDRNLDVQDFDGRGMYLSRELQRELGSEYRVHYHFTFAGSRAKWAPVVADDPCPGWIAS